MTFTKNRPVCNPVCMTALGKDFLGTYRMCQSMWDPDFFDRGTQFLVGGTGAPPMQYSYMLPSKTMFSPPIFHGKLVQVAWTN